MSLTPAQLDQFHRDGYIIVPDLFTADEMDAALAAMEQIFYGQSFQQWLSDCDQGDASGVSDGFTTTHDHSEGRSQFPVGAPALDRLIENETYLDIFEQCLGVQKPATAMPTSSCARGLLTSAIPTILGRATTLTTIPIACCRPTTKQAVSTTSIQGYICTMSKTTVPPCWSSPARTKWLVPLLCGRLPNDNAAGGSFKDLRQATELAAPVPSTGRRGVGFILLVVPSTRGPTLRQ